MQSFIIFIISNFTLTFFVLGIVLALISLALKRKPLTTAVVIDVFFSYFLLCSIGISYFYNFIMHVFFGQIAADFIGWAQSPFQAEVGFASLGFAIVGMLSFASGFSFRAATVLAPAFFLWGAAGGHIYQMEVAGNFAPGNAGVIFWTDIFIPVISFVLLYLQHKFPNH
ncbi:MAG: hypothetical protein K0U23_05280 [Gammaproteobacteria bacterium]|nr:hypothetical protein [Gammaproteobacteria bacterium]